MRLLYYRWEAYTKKDIEEALNRLRIPYGTFDRTTSDYDLEDPVFCEELEKTIKKGGYDVVFGVNYTHKIAEVCWRTGVPYLSWSYDSPMSYGKMAYLSVDTSHLFMFDRAEVLSIQESCPDAHIHHLPLAVDTSRMDRYYCSAGERKKYKSDVSFVGQLYSRNSDQAINFLPDYEKGFLNALKDAQFRIYGEEVISKALSDEVMKAVSTPEFMKEMGEKAIYNELADKLPFIPARALWVMMTRGITRKERVLLLSLLSNHFDTALYSYDDHEVLGKVRMCGEINYTHEMPKLFKTSLINLNITLRSILTGIPQRCLDIMGCQGFLLSNYQTELAEHFTDGEDCAIYTSIEEALEKCSYYMKHDIERKRIAQNGYLKVKNEFTYDERLRTIFETVGIPL